MNKIRILLASLLAAVFLTVGGVSSQASTDYLACYQAGGRISNPSYSESAIRIYSSGPSYYNCGYDSLGIKQVSWYKADTKDVDAFYVGRGYRCVSQWGYSYYGNIYGTWFWLSSDSVYLVLDCSKMAAGTYSFPNTGEPDTLAEEGVAPPE